MKELRKTEKGLRIETRAGVDGRGPVGLGSRTPRSELFQGVLRDPARTTYPSPCKEGVPGGVGLSYLHWFPCGGGLVEEFTCDGGAPEFAPMGLGFPSLTPWRTLRAMRRLRSTVR